MIYLGQPDLLFLVQVMVHVMVVELFFIACESALVVGQLLPQLRVFPLLGHLTLYI